MEYLNSFKDFWGIQRNFRINEASDILEIQDMDEDRKPYIFRITDRICKPYLIWNIGDNMGIDSYIPLVKMKMVYHPDVREVVDTSSMQAIKLSPAEVRILRRAASRGGSSLERLNALENIDQNLKEQAIKILTSISVPAV